MFLEEHRIWVSRLSKEICPPNVDEHHPNLLRTQKEQKEEGRAGSFSLFELAIYFSCHQPSELLSWAFGLYKQLFIMYWLAFANGHNLKLHRGLLRTSMVNKIDKRNRNKPYPFDYAAYGSKALESRLWQAQFTNLWHSIQKTVFKRLHQPLGLCKRI